jgi:hypothetical protein
MSQQSKTYRSEPPSAAARRVMRPLRVAEIAALFSEGLEPEARHPSRVRWPALAAIKKRLSKLFLRREPGTR